MVAAAIGAAAALLAGCSAPAPTATDASGVPPASVTGTGGPATGRPADTTMSSTPNTPNTSLPAGDALSVPWTDPAGTASTYHLFRAALGNRVPVGLVVYLDGDGMHGHDHPSDDWALGGPDGVVAQAARRGYPTLSIRTPDRQGAATFWEDGGRNADYVAALIDHVQRSLGTTTVWLVGYSGGSQLITQFLLPRHAGLFRAGGAVITGGGGPPEGAAPASFPEAFPEALRANFPLLWYTGSRDDGTTAGDGYDALADAKQGAAWYRARGLQATFDEAPGLDHEDLGSRFGTILGARLDDPTARP